jgi:hypothetical protein
MYVRAMMFECRDDVREQDIADVYYELVETAESLDGFRGSTLLMSEEDCRGIALIFWIDRDSAIAASERLLPLLGARIHEVLFHPPDIAGYNVIDERFINQNSSN